MDRLPSTPTPPATTRPKSPVSTIGQAEHAEAGPPRATSSTETSGTPLKVRQATTPPMPGLHRMILFGSTQLQFHLQGITNPTLVTPPPDSTAAVVNAANSSLHGTGGVAPLIQNEGWKDDASYKAALKAFKAERTQGETPLRANGDLPTGQSIAMAIAPGSRFNQCRVTHVIHTVGPTGDLRDRAKLLSSSYRTILQASLDNQIDVLVIPPISTGIFNYPPQEAARVAAATITAFLHEHPGAFKELRFCFFSKDLKQEMGKMALYIEAMENPPTLEALWAELSPKKAPATRPAPTRLASQQADRFSAVKALLSQENAVEALTQACLPGKELYQILEACCPNAPQQDQRFDVFQRIQALKVELFKEVLQDSFETKSFLDQLFMRLETGILATQSTGMPFNKTIPIHLGNIANEFVKEEAALKLIAAAPGTATQLGKEGGAAKLEAIQTSLLVLTTQMEWLSNKRLQDKEYLPLRGNLQRQAFRLLSVLSADNRSKLPQAGVTPTRSQARAQQIDQFYHHTVLPLLGKATASLDPKEVAAAINSLRRMQKNMQDWMAKHPQHSETPEALIQETPEQIPKQS